MRECVRGERVEESEKPFCSLFFGGGSLERKTKEKTHLQPRGRHHRPEVRLRPRGQSRLQLFHQRVHCDPGGPHARPKGDLGLFAVGSLDPHRPFARPLPADLEHSRVQDQLDAGALELLVGVLGYGAVVGGEEVVLEFDDADATVLDDLCERIFFESFVEGRGRGGVRNIVLFSLLQPLPFLLSLFSSSSSLLLLLLAILTRVHLDQIVVDHVVQLRGDLHARGTSAADHKGQEPLALLGGGLRQGGPLEALRDVAAELGGVLDRLEEEGVLLFFFGGGGGGGGEGGGERERERGRERERARARERESSVSIERREKKGERPGRGKKMMCIGEEEKVSLTSTPFTPKVLFVHPTDITRMS